MSRFSINNPAFLSMAGNIGGSKGSGTFYIEAIEDNTLLTFTRPSFTEVSENDTSYSVAPESMTLNSGDKIFIKSNVITDINDTSYTLFSIDKQYNAGGICPVLHFMAEMDGTPIDATIGIEFDNTPIVDASNLIIDIVNLSTGHSFKDCTSLTSAPQLTATTLAESCYLEMFSGCTSLTVAPQLPATTLADKCYHSMFKNCTSLISAPQLPATTLEASCYEAMFNRCSSLTIAPELPATILVSTCYLNMFKNCNSLTKIVCLASGYINGTNSWVDGVSPTGTFIKASDAEWQTGVNGIPEGWTVQDYAG